MTKSAGYSGTPLVKKLGLKPEHRAVAISAPDHYRDLLDGTEISGITAASHLSGAYNFIHLFCSAESVLRDSIATCEKHLALGGMIWVSWPKKSSKLWVDLTEGGIRKAVFPLNLVDVKVCAVDVDWSGLKVMRRKTPKQ